MQLFFVCTISERTFTSSVSALAAPSVGCPFVFNQYYLDAIDVFLCPILSCVFWFTKVKIILDNQE